MRTLRDNPMGAGEIYERKNIAILLKRIPATVVVGLLYGFYYDIHAAQTGISGTPEGRRMESVYAHASKFQPRILSSVYISLMTSILTEKYPYALALPASISVHSLMVLQERGRAHLLIRPGANRLHGIVRTWCK